MRLRRRVLIVHLRLLSTFQQAPARAYRRQQAAASLTPIDGCAWADTRHGGRDSQLRLCHLQAYSWTHFAGALSFLVGSCSGFWAANIGITNI
jgi:hypothetical protein